MKKLKVVLVGYLFDIVTLVACAIMFGLSLRTPVAPIFAVAAIVLACRACLDVRVVEVEEEGEKVYYVVQLDQLLFQKFYRKEEAEELRRKLRDVLEDC